MSKISLSVSLDARLHAEARRLVEADEFDSLSALVAEAIQALVQRYEAVEQRIEDSMAGRVFQGLMNELDVDERAQFDEFLTAYVGVAQPLLSDDDMVSLLSSFTAHGLKRSLTALHEIQTSKVLLTPHYLETMLEEKVPPVVKQTLTQIETSTPPRVSFGVDNPTLAVVAKLYETEIGGLTEKIGEQLKALIADYPAVEHWHEAFEAAATMNKRNLRYVAACLKGVWKTKIEAQKGRSKDEISKRERHHSEKRKRVKDYENYWNEDFESTQKKQPHSH